MLNNDKYFNQSIITSENIQNRLSQFVEGLDINAQGDLVLILAGDDTNRLQARRKTQNQEITLKVSLNKDGTMDIEEQENISERIDPKKTRTLKR